MNDVERREFDVPVEYAFANLTGDDTIPYDNRVACGPNYRACHPKSSQRCKFEHDCSRTAYNLWDLPDVTYRKFVEWPGGDQCPGRSVSTDEGE